MGVAQHSPQTGHDNNRQPCLIVAHLARPVLARYCHRQPIGHVFGKTGCLIVTATLDCIGRYN